MNKLRRSEDMACVSYTRTHTYIRTTYKYLVYIHIHVHTMEYYSAIKKNEIMAFAAM